MRFLLARSRRPAPVSVLLVPSAVSFIALSVLSARAQLPQQPGAPATDISNIPKPVITTIDGINMRNGPNDARTPKKTVVTNDTCLLPPLTLVGNATIAAPQLQIAPKAKKNYLRACADLSNRKPDEAEKHLRIAVDASPNYAAAWLTLGQLLSTQKRTEEGRQACARASIADPKYVPAYLCLADIAAHAHAWDEVLKLTQHAIALDPANDAIVYEYHAAANLHLHQLADAEKSGLRAVELDNDHHEPRAYFVLAQIYEAKGDTAKEIRQLREYLKYTDNPEDVAAVKTFLAALENPAANQQAANATPIENPPETIEGSRQSWGPPDINQAIPPVQADVVCPLPQILEETSHRTEDLIENLQRFSADECIEQIDVDKSGKSRSVTRQVMNYVAAVENNAAGYPAIKEFRAGSAGLQKASVVDTGSAAFALLFFILLTWEASTFAVKD
jgi:Tfp pilus assembly protein PilF